MPTLQQNNLERIQQLDKAFFPTNRNRLSNSASVRS